MTLDHTHTGLPSTGLPPVGVLALGPGSQLGPYRLIEPLGKGGMGQVWKATDGKRSVALKLLPMEFRGNAAAVAQVDEAFQLVHTLTHQHICKALGLFDDPIYGPYLTMDFIPGVTLSQFQRQYPSPHRRMPLELVCEILRPVALALDHAHQKLIRLKDREQRGVLHRDVKPDNILLVLKDGQVLEVWLIDFGLAAEIRNTMSKQTMVPVDTRGTRPYMAPEQFRGKRHLWDQRTDQYSLAVVAYELLSGHLPFDGDDDFSLMHAVLNEPVDPIEGVSEPTNAILLKGLAKGKETRFETCVELIDSLARSATTTSRIPVPKVIQPVQEKPSPVAASLVGDRAGDQREVLTGMKFRWCPAGSFTMGSPKYDNLRFDNEDQVEVTLTQGFWLGETVVTQQQWIDLMKTKPWHGKSYVKEGDNYPATYISQGDGGSGKLERDSASAFCVELTKASHNSGRLGREWKFALPTEAQWEYACRAGTKTKFSFGDDVNLLGECAWFSKNAGNTWWEKYAHEVGEKRSNPWGLYDIHGNTWEWCSDWYVEKVSGGQDPFGPSSGSYRVYRGGSWSSYASYCRSADRSGNSPDDRSGNLGFRLALVPSGS